MDTRTGELRDLSAIAAGDRHHFVPVGRVLTDSEIHQQKIPRNAPCVCGSGKKAKLCCLIRDRT